MSREDALTKGFAWKEPNPKDYQPQTYSVPDNIQDVPDIIIKEILACEKCGKNYKIVDQEFQFYKKFNLPIPRNCFNCRHQERMSQRNSRRLWQRKCSKCNAEMQTTYSPERPEKIYCEQCYLKEIY